MFQTNEEFLTLLGEFAVTGVFIAVFCDAIRFLRTIAGGGKITVFITDLLMTVFSALFLLFASIETSSGSIRLYYILAAMLGMAVYFATIGVITGFISRFLAGIFAGFRRTLVKLIYNPIVKLFSFIKQKMLNVLVQLQQKTSKYKENLHFGLKKRTPLLYNNKIGKLCTNGGEERNVIKAKVRKKA